MVGAGMSSFDMFSDKDSKDLFAEAFVELNTSVDKGLDPADIDALYLGNFTNDFLSGSLIGVRFFPILSGSFPNRQHEPKAPVLQVPSLSVKAFSPSLRASTMWCLLAASKICRSDPPKRWRKDWHWQQALTNAKRV